MIRMILATSFSQARLEDHNQYSPQGDPCYADPNLPMNFGDQKATPQGSRDKNHR